MKKLILITIVLLLGIDVALLFSAQAQEEDNNDMQTLQQLQQLRQQPSAKTSSTAMQANANQSLLAQNSAPANVGAAAQQATPATPALPSSTPQLQPMPAPMQQAQQAYPQALPTSNPDPAAAMQQQQASQYQQYQQPIQQYQQSPMQQAMPKQTPEQQAVSEEAFNTMARNALPMSPDQIQRLRRMFTVTQYAAAASPGTPPRPTATSQLVNLAPGATPPVIRLAQGFVTSLVFVDSTGMPWPIEAYDIGNPQAFNIQWNKSDNNLMIQSTTLYTYGNLAVRLRGLATPVMITLIPGQQAVDYRVDMRVPGLGPNANPTVLGDGLPNGANPVLLGVLDGVPPAGSRILNVSGGDAQAWQANDRIYIRTRLTILSPSWLATMSSADGTKAYEMQKTPLLLVSRQGKIIQLKIEGL